MAAAAVRTGWSRWIVKEAYPLYFFTSCAACAFFGMVGRTIASDPDIRFYKDMRSKHFPDTERDFQIGNNHYDHFLRRASRNKEIGIFPNAAMTKVD